MTRPLRFGSLGCGRIVVRGLIPGVVGCPDAELAAVASQRPGVAAAFAAEHCIGAAYDGYDSLLADPDVDAVYIPCQGHEHGRWTMAAAKAGKHVLCEKPLARDSAEAAEMIRECRSAGVILMEAFMWRHHPRTKRAVEEVRSGGIGELRSVLASFGFCIDRADWRLDPAKAGGSLFDVGCYGIDCARLFTQEEPVQVQAAARLWETGVDMTALVGLTFPSGVLASVECSFETPFRCRAEIVGTGGRIVLEDAFLPPDPCQIHVWRGEATEPEVEVFTGHDQYVGEVACFVASVRAGSLQWPAENGAGTMAVLDETLALIGRP